MWGMQFFLTVSFDYRCRELSSEYFVAILDVG